MRCEESGDDSANHRSGSRRRTEAKWCGGCPRMPGVRHAHNARRGRSRPIARTSPVGAAAGRLAFPRAARWTFADFRMPASSSSSAPASSTIRNLYALTKNSPRARGLRRKGADSLIAAIEASKSPLQRFLNALESVTSGRLPRSSAAFRDTRCNTVGVSGRHSQRPGIGSNRRRSGRLFLRSCGTGARRKGAIARLEFHGAARGRGRWPSQWKDTCDHGHSADSEQGEGDGDNRGGRRPRHWIGLKVDRLPPRR